MKNYYVYLIKSYTIICNYIHQNSQNKTHKSYIKVAGRIQSFWTFKCLISQAFKSLLIQARDFCVQFVN